LSFTTLISPGSLKLFLGLAPFRTNLPPHLKDSIPIFLDTFLYLSITIRHFKYAVSSGLINISHLEQVFDANLALTYTARNHFMQIYIQHTSSNKPNSLDIFTIDEERSQVKLKFTRRYEAKFYL
jgi:hypothetical protein